MTTPKQRALQALQSQGACNPIGLANTLAAWGKDILAEGGGTDAVKADPACRLLTYQLAWLMGVGEEFSYSALVDEVNAQAQVLP